MRDVIHDDAHRPRVALQRRGLPVLRRATGGEGDQPVVRDVVSIKYSFDERITDGLYCAKSLDIFKGWMADPDALERPL